ncbi:MAG: hypothetical protein R3C26_09660 [Calditrichia bacterium]
MSNKQDVSVIKDHQPISEVKAQLDKFEPVDIDFDESVLSDGDRQALVKLVSRQADGRNFPASGVCPYVDCEMR